MLLFLGASQGLLRNPAFTAALNPQLSRAHLTTEALANFLYNGPPEDRPPGMPAYDWRNAFNSTSEALLMLAQFVGVRVPARPSARPPRGATSCLPHCHMGNAICEGFREGRDESGMSFHLFP